MSGNQDHDSTYTALLRWRERLRITMHHEAGTPLETPRQVYFATCEPVHNDMVRDQSVHLALISRLNKHRSS